MGLGEGILFVPTVSITCHHFAKRRSLATGGVLSGISAGATVFPIYYSTSLPSWDSAQLTVITFRKSDLLAPYASGNVVIGTLVAGNALIRTRPRPPRATSDIKSFFKDGAYLWAILGQSPRVLLSSTGVYLPVIYIQRFAVQHSVGSNLAISSIASMNGTSAFGRIAANFLADIHGPLKLLTDVVFPVLLYLGPFYLHVVCTLITSKIIWVVWGFQQPWCS
ncbi:MFS general substrate transporter [Mycena venus]|uniref:MFS general substrate transporter n=1 Tax=Mycena venus TaxID=2733690 RepID=A0A8H7CJ31_9AGAR|nr:MFS general substrate transporter [Mycena venus]